MNIVAVAPQNTPPLATECATKLCRKSIHCANEYTVCAEHKKIRGDLDFVRKEIHFENNIMAQRLTGFIVCQSLLISPLVMSLKVAPSDKLFFISNINIFSLSLILIGIFSSYQSIISIHCAVNTLNMWCKKSLYLKNIINYDTNIRIIRESINFENDEIHKKSMNFYRYIPMLFFIFWISMLFLIKNTGAYDSCYAIIEHIPYDEYKFHNFAQCMNGDFFIIMELPPLNRTLLV